MIYFVSLRSVALVIGLLYLISHLLAAWQPKAAQGLLRRGLANYPLGAGLMLAATLWFVILTAKMDLGELSGMRYPLLFIWLLAGVLVVIFVRGFLVARALGCLLLLAAAVILDAAFLLQTPARYVMTLLAYAWAIFGMILVYSPHYLRDWLYFATTTPRRLQLFAWPGAIFGLILVVLAFTFYNR